MKVISGSGHLAHEGKSYHVGEAFAGQRVGLHLDAAGRTELHFANVHLGDLTCDAEGGRFRPAAYLAEPAPKPTGDWPKTVRRKTAQSKP